MPHMLGLLGHTEVGHACLTCAVNIRFNIHGLLSEGGGRRLWVIPWADHVDAELQVALKSS